MSRTFLQGVLAFCIVGLLAVGAGADEKEAKDKKALDDKTFVMKATSGNMHEIKLGGLAAKRGDATEVKEFGEKMVKDHGKVLADLKKAAKSAGVEAPAKMAKHHQDDVVKFEKLEGKRFDAAYVRQMIHDHEETAMLLEKASKDVKSDDLRAFADKTLPGVREHLKMIKKIADSMGLKDTAEKDKRKER